MTTEANKDLLIEFGQRIINVWITRVRQWTLHTSSSQTKGEPNDC